MSEGMSFEHRDRSVATLLRTAQEALWEAYAVIRADVADEVTPGEVLDQIALTQQVVDVAQAVQTHRLAQHAGTIAHHDDSGNGDDRASRGGAPATGSWADARRFADVAGELRWGPRVAAYRCRDAITAVTAFPSLVDALAEGAIDLNRLTAVVAACRDIPEERVPAVAPMVEHAMLEGARGGIGSWTATTTRKRARAAVAAVDALAPVRHRARSIQEAVGVTFEPGRVQGTSALTATLTTQQAAAVRAAVEQLAVRCHNQHVPTDAHDQQGSESVAGSNADVPLDPVLTLNQWRAQALVDLICANVTVEASATFLVPVNTPRQALVGRALEGLGELIASQGLQLSVAPIVPEHPPGWVTSPDDQLATPTELVRFGQGSAGPDPSLVEQRTSVELVETTSVEHPTSVEQPASVEHPTSVELVETPPSICVATVPEPPWTPPSCRTAMDDLTAHADAMAQIGDRVTALTEHVDAADGHAELPSGLDAADQQTWQAGRPDDVVVDGVGVIHAETVTGLVTALGVTIGRALVDPTTGTVREHKTDAYRPTEAMRALIHDRDRTCRFPGCTRPAPQTDADHVIPYGQGGPTSPSNLIALCRTHHRAKGSGAWRVELHDDDSVTWTSLAGRQHRTWPATDPAPF